RPGGMVNALALAGEQVYVGGAFAGAGPPLAKIARLARIKPDGALDTGWAPAPDDAVLALTTVGSTVYAGGWFSTIGGQPATAMAAISATTGAVAAFNPADSAVLALTASGSTVYAAGNFGTFLGQTRRGLAAFDATTGALSGWNPNVVGTPSALQASAAT